MHERKLLTLSMRHHGVRQDATSHGTQDAHCLSMVSTRSRVIGWAVPGRYETVSLRRWLQRQSMIVLPGLNRSHQRRLYTIQYYTTTYVEHRFKLHKASKYRQHRAISHVPCHNNHSHQTRSNNDYIHDILPFIAKLIRTTAMSLQLLQRRRESGCHTITMQFRLGMQCCLHRAPISHMIAT
jgi:hypothetical protein